jgi:hypothetical protein
VSDPKS